LVTLVGAWIRVCIWYCVCLFQNNTLHVILENDLSRGSWDWRSCVSYSTVLLFSACWTATQVREQILPGLSPPTGLKLLAGVLSLATLYRMRGDEILFVATVALTAIGVVTPVLTLDA
jgi:hypothetical protein